MIDILTHTLMAAIYSHNKGRGIIVQMGRWAFRGGGAYRCNIAYHWRNNMSVAFPKYPSSKNNEVF